VPNTDGTLSYYETITAAVADVAAHGYDSEERVAYWAEAIRRAAERSMRSEAEIETMVRDALGAVFRKQVDLGGVLRRNPAVSPYTLERIRPELHAELSRRVAANINLIKLNRPIAVARTQARFRGWATSVPPGGSDTVARAEVKKDVRKALAQLPFEERRVVIDQSAKLFASISATVALAGNAIGAEWHSHRYQAGYNGRPAHNARDGKFFLVRGSWAQEAGLVRPGPAGYTDDVEQPAELPFCKCSFEYKFSLRSIPDVCLTDKGREALRSARAKIASAA
jgi:DNA-directed RNA polymerase specialized sigma24 family protein